VLAGLAAVAALLALSIQIEVAHPFHAALAILGYGLIYIGIGAMIASFIRGELEGSLAVALIFLLDVFSGPGMTEGDGSPLSVTRTAADVLIAAATGTGSPAGEWVELLAWVVSSLTIAAVAFAISARGPSPPTWASASLRAGGSCSCCSSACPSSSSRARSRRP
jgi:hypothetical protein